MNEILYLFAAVVALACTLATITVWAPRKLWIRVVAVVFAGLLIPTAYASLNELLSRPKPVSIEWARAATEEATVIGSSIREGEAIYLWLQIEDIAEPRAYVLPWSKQLAKQLHEAQKEVGKKGGTVGMRQPFEASVDENTTRTFYARPQPRPAFKTVPAQAPQQYQHPRLGL